jgi:hypothetical protein
MQAKGLTPPANLEPDWRVSYLDHLTRGDLPLDKTKAQRIARRAKTFVIFGDNKELYQRSPTASYNAVSQMRKARTCSKIYTRGLAVITRYLEPSLEMHSDKVSTGQPWSSMLLSWYAPAKDASTMQGKPTS